MDKTRLRHAIDKSVGEDKNKLWKFIAITCQQVPRYCPICKQAKEELEKKEKRDEKSEAAREMKLKEGKLRNEDIKIEGHICPRC